MTYIYFKRELRKQKSWRIYTSSGSLLKKSAGTTERFFKKSLGLKGLKRFIWTKFSYFIAKAYLFYLNRNTSNPILEYFKNKKLPNDKTNNGSPECMMDIFKICCINQYLGEALTVTAFIWGARWYWTNLLDIIWY